MFSGVPERAARDNATPVVSADVLSAWATEQASLIPCLYDSPEDQMECATVIRRCGGQTSQLPVAKYGGSYVSFEDIKALELPDEVFITSPYRVSDIEELDGFEFAPGVFVTQVDSWMSILQTNQFSRWPDSLFKRWGHIMSASTTLGGSVIEAVAQAWSCPLEELARQTTDRERRRDERSIGHLDGQEIRRDVLVLTKPQSSAATDTQAQATGGPTTPCTPTE